MNKLVLVGGGGHCHSVIEAVESEGKFRIAGVLDKDKRKGELILNYPVLGGDEAIPDLVKSDHSFLITVGQIHSNSIRTKIFQSIEKEGGELATVIASTAKVSEHAKLGKGLVVLHFALVNAGAEVGDNCIINTAAIVEHDVKIGKHCHISTGATINGTSTIGDNSFVGSNVVINHQLTIGPNSIIASGSLVTKNLKGNNTYMGSPVKVG